VHYAVSTLTRDRAPVWLQEGLAKFLERRWREPVGARIPPAMEHLLAKALRSGKLITFEAMHPSMAKLPSAEDATLAFAEVANAIAFLHQQAGMAGLRTALARVADGTDARAAVAGAANVSWAEFERGWRAYMVAQKYKTFPAIDIPTTHIRKESAIASQRKPSEDETLSQTAKVGGAAPFKFLRLGNMFLRRGRPRAAVVEYEKGAKAVLASPRTAGDGTVGWLFPVKLGRTYLALGEPDRALRSLGRRAGDVPRPAVAARHRGRGSPREVTRRARRGDRRAEGRARDQPLRSRDPLRPRRRPRQGGRRRGRRDRARTEVLQGAVGRRRMRRKQATGDRQPEQATISVAVPSALDHCRLPVAGSSGQPTADGLEQRRGCDAGSGRSTP
jgi:hypothetical protein